MKHYTDFFGVDVSKKTIDVSHFQNETLTHHQFSNDATGMKEVFKWLEELNVNFESTLFCMEATGIYCYQLTTFLQDKNIDTWVEHALQIKKAMPLARGKNDKVDSKRIAIYASKNIDRLRLFKPMNTTLEKIKHLATLRERLVETQKRLIVPIKEFEDIGDTAMAKLLSKSIKKSADAIEKDLINLEKKII